MLLPLSKTASFAYFFSFFLSFFLPFFFAQPTEEALDTDAKNKSDIERRNAAAFRSRRMPLRCNVCGSIRATSVDNSRILHTDLATGFISIRKHVHSKHRKIHFLFLFSVVESNDAKGKLDGELPLNRRFALWIIRRFIS